jgi:hypothetical protein
VFAMGTGIQRQFISVAYMRLFVVRYPDRDAPGVGDAEEEKGTTGMYFVTWHLVSFIPRITLMEAYSVLVSLPSPLHAWC